MIAARQMYLGRGGGGGGWVNPYDPNGMLEFWDAEWNGGGGVHNTNSNTCLPLVEGGALLEFGDNSTLSDKYIDCSIGGGLIVAECPNLVSPTDNRRVAFPQTIVFCMRFNLQKNSAYVIRIGLTGLDTRIYSQDGYNLKWAYLGGLYDASGMSPSDNELCTIGISMTSRDIRLYVNGDNQRASTSTFMWCIGGGISFLCNGEVDKNVVNGRFYNAMMYNRALSTEELDAIRTINQARFNLP